MYNYTNMQQVFNYTNVQQVYNYTFNTDELCSGIANGRVLNLVLLGNLPVERAKDAVCFLQRGGLSLVSSAIIYNIVKVKVTR